ncbi:hypothetical protein PGB90_003518 [Kerria lacca]
MRRYRTEVVRAFGKMIQGKQNNDLLSVLYTSQSRAHFSPFGKILWNQTGSNFLPYFSVVVKSSSAIISSIDRILCSIKAHLTWSVIVGQVVGSLKLVIIGLVIREDVLLFSSFSI